MNLRPLFPLSLKSVPDANPAPKTAIQSVNVKPEYATLSGHGALCFMTGLMEWHLSGSVADCKAVCITGPKVFAWLAAAT